MTPATTPSDASLPPTGASAGIDGLLIASELNGVVWAALGKDFARFFAPPPSAPCSGECTMDSPTL
jgi:hypothetical protein